MTKDLQDKLDAMTRSAIFGEQTATTATTANESTLTPEKLKAAMAEWDKLLRNARHSQVTFIVDQAHEGLMIQHETPNDGTRIELSWTQANEVHQHWPLKLHEVISTEAAEFVPLMVGESCASRLPMPPYDVPEPETFEDWMDGNNQQLVEKK